MGKLLRILVVFILILSVVALALGIILFKKRETLKGHVITLARHVTALTPFIEAEQSDDLTDKENKKVSDFFRESDLLDYKPNPKDPTAPTTMDTAMRDLLARVQNQLAHLNDTRDALARRNKEYEEATNTIARLEGNIQQLESEKATLQSQVASLQKDLAEKKAKIEDLTARTEELQGTIEDMKDRIARLNDTIKDKEDTIRAQERTIEDLRRKIAPTGTDAPAEKVEQGHKGRVALVNPEWNFVVIALAPNVAVSRGLALTVHRGDRYVGKVRIADFNDQYHLAIADILTDWKELEAEVGDNVFY